MKNFIIVTDTCSDLGIDLREKHDIDYIPMTVSYDGKSIPASLDFEDISFKDFYKMMDNGTRFTTSQVTKQDYVKRFEKYANDGCDILCIACSSALSASINASLQAREDVMKRYPDTKIICIDSLMSGLGLGIMCIMASNLREQGKTIEETANFIEKHKLNIHQFGTVNELKFLKLSGRISATTSLLGTIFNVKPVLISDIKGQNVSIEKCKGRKTVIERMAELVKENYTGKEYKDILIAHADCEEDANRLKELILNNLPENNINIYIGCLGPILGASCGPKTLAVYFYGKEVTYLAQD